MSHIYFLFTLLRICIPYIQYTYVWVRMNKIISCVYKSSIPATWHFNTWLMKYILFISAPFDIIYLYRRDIHREFILITLKPVVTFGNIQALATSCLVKAHYALCVWDEMECITIKLYNGCISIQNVMVCITSYTNIKVYFIRFPFLSILASVHLHVVVLYTGNAGSLLYEYE